MAVNLTESKRETTQPHKDGVIVKFRDNTPVEEAQRVVEQLKELHFKFFGEGVRNLQAEIGGQPLTLSPISASAPGNSGPEA